jgi:competence protein ComEA
VDTPGQHHPRRRRLTIGAGVVLVLLAVAAAVLVAALSPHGSTTTVGGSDSGPSAYGDASNDEPLSGESPSAAPGAAVPDDGSPSGGATLFIHILGEVANPGLYELREGDRAIDAVAAAGGLTEAADEAQLNLARFLNDGEQIVVPAVGAVAQPGVPAPGTGQSGTGGSGTGPLAGAAISLNTADAATLEDLPGVGPELASRIVAWRETNGPYTSVDDLLNVAGIGEKTVDGLRDSATV